MANVFNITNIKAFILSVVIAIVLTSFVVYVIETFDPSPDYQDFCGEARPRAPSLKGEEIDQASCEEVEGAKWINGYCDYTYECQQEYDEARDNHRQTVFFITVPAGIIAVAVGIMLALPSVSSGLMLGGVFLTIFGVSQYWSDLSNWARALLLGILLIILIWLGYKKLER